MQATSLLTAGIVAAWAAALAHDVRSGGSTPVPAETAAPSSRPAPREERWSLLPRAVASFGAAVDGPWLYVYGGHVGKAHQHSTANVVGETYRLSLLDGTSWEALAPGTALQSVALVASGGGVIRLGGMQPRNAAGAPEDLVSVDEVARYDAAAGAWSPLPALRSARSSHDAVAVGSRVYVVGGWTLRGKDDEVWVRDVDAIDLAAPSPKWERVAEAPFERRAVAAAALDGKLFVLGGLDPDGEMSSRVDVLDLAKGSWSQGPDLPGTGFGCSAIAAGGRLYATVMEGSVVRLSERGDAWEPVGDLAFPRFFHRLVADRDGRLLAVGGTSSTGGHLRAIETVDVAAPASPRFTRWSVPFSGSARNRQGLAVRGQELLVFGGNQGVRQHDFQPEHFAREAWSVRLGSGEVRRLADLDEGRQSLATVSVADASGKERARTFALGGFSFGASEGVALSRTSAYELKTGGEADRLAATLPQPRTQHQAVAYDGRVWIFGGLDYDPRRGDDAFRHVLPVLSWNPADPESSIEPAGIDLPRSRRAFGAAVLDGRCYLVGGMREEFEPVVECDVLDLASRTWSTMPPPPRPRVGADLVALGGKLYLAGGSTPSPGDGEPTPCRALEAFDPKTSSWSTVLDAIPVGARHVRMLVCGSRLLLVGTGGERDALELALVRP
ncbi:MAG TPA: kelch repeat-containing protein [Planctomycetota bacterium]|nr:kelch repeat-containing protein [Planctomycetota bacterium]